MPIFNVNDSITELENMFEDLNATFMIVKNKSEDINFDFDKLQKDFLIEPVVMNTEEMYGETTYFDYLGAGVLSLIVFFICVLAPALNVIAEKESNTLYRLSTTPANTSMIFFGKFLLFLIFGFVEMMYTLTLAIVLYNLRITGSIYEVVAILTLLACASIAIGLFISSKVSTMQQALIIVPVLVIPSFLISNSFFPPDIMPAFMDYISMITPMTFSNHALNNVMIKGFSLSFVWVDLLVLFMFMLVPLVLFIWSYRRIKY
ncbi:MAG: ABC transporter permease, partial [archaeon]